MTTEEQMTALGLPEDEAVAVATGLRMLALVQPESVRTALVSIGRAEAMAPFLDPTGLVTGALSFNRGRRNTELLRAVLRLVEVLDSQRTEGRRG